MDLLGSILGSMEKPPSLGDDERKKARERKKQMEKIQQDEKDRLKKFRVQMQKKIEGILKDSALHKYKFEHMDKVYRAIVHEVADTAGLTSFSFGMEEEDRYVMVWKKEFAPGDEELAAYKRGEEWDPEKAKQLALEKEAEEADDHTDTHRKNSQVPQSNYRDKYEHLIGRVAAKDAAAATTANRSYGNVPSENKRDQRTIEQVMADTRAKKRQKTDADPASQESLPSGHTEQATSHQAQTEGDSACDPEGATKSQT